MQALRPRSSTTQAHTIASASCGDAKSYEDAAPSSLILFTSAANVFAGARTAAREHLKKKGLATGAALTHLLCWRGRGKPALHPGGYDTFSIRESDVDDNVLHHKKTGATSSKKYRLNVGYMSIWYNWLEKPSQFMLLPHLIVGYLRELVPGHQLPSCPARHSSLPPRRRRPSPTPPHEVLEARSSQAP